MPARTLTGNLEGVQMPELVRRLAGAIDTPIARVRATWGVSSGTAPNIQRTLTLVVTDRLSKRFGPSEFEQDGQGAGRWLIAWGVASAAHGTLQSLTVGSPSMGATVGTLGNLHLSRTDDKGVFRATVTCGLASGADAHLLAGVVGLLQTRDAIKWGTGAAESSEIP
jgi:hypothetical protein